MGWGLRAAVRGDGKRQEKELDWCWLNEPIFSESVKVMTQWKCFDESHYTKPEPVWLQRASLQSMIISLWESIPGRQKQSQWLCILLWLLSPVLQSKAISSTITESYIQEWFTIFFPECHTLRVNEALYQQSTSSIHVYGADGILLTPWKQSWQLYGSVSLEMPS